MSMHERYYRPALKNSVDVQLQTAFSDGNWPTVIRLASKRASALKDPYYEAIKICAESQLEGPVERSAVAVAVESLARNASFVPDLETLELYEWACQDAQPAINYSETLGTLRVRWVRANPKSAVAVDCLKACLLQWDLVNAQQIAAILDRAHNNSEDRRYLFWSITLTYLLSMSTQCPEAKSSIYRTLAVRQLEKLADVSDSTKDGDGLNRGLQEEEELNLYYSVLKGQNLHEELLKRLRSPTIGALKQLDQGRKHLFVQSLDEFVEIGNWDAIYDFSLQALSRSDDNGAPSLLALDWRVWKNFIKAASQKPNLEVAFKEVQEVLQRFTSIESKVAPMYTKNIALALLEFTFQVPSSLLVSDPRAGVPTPRVIQLCLYLDQNFKTLSAFDDVKEYIEQLNFEESRSLLKVMLPKIAKDGDKLKALSMRVLQVKLQYFLTTCCQTLTHGSSREDSLQQASLRCKFCSSWTKTSCTSCLANVLFAAIAAYKAVKEEPETSEDSPKLDKDPRVDLATVAVMALLKLAGLETTSFSPLQPPLSETQTSRLLQAVLIADFQLSKTPNEVPLRLLLVQLYLLLGCASQAYQVWVPMDVKRTIQDALSPMFFDRISSVSPGLFHGERRPLMEPLRSYFSSTLRGKGPVRIWDAFSVGNYSAILDMAQYTDRLRSSCTLIMTVVEERRATRAFGGKIEQLLDELPLLSDVNEDTTFVNVTDYGSLPNLESSSGPPLAHLVRLGPGLSNERSHLGLFAEQYLDLITFKPPKDYRPSKPADIAASDKDYVVETLTRLRDLSFTYLHARNIISKLTPAEWHYYNALSLLTSTLLISLTTLRSEAVSSPWVSLISSIKSTISSLRSQILSNTPSSADTADLFFFLTNLATFSALRDVALAVKYSVEFLQSYNDSETSRDRSGKSSLHKEVTAGAKSLETLATKTLADAKIRIKTLKDIMSQGGWLDRMADLAFGVDGERVDEIGKHIMTIVGRPAVEDWGSRVVESWREGVKGWGGVKME